MINKQPEAFKQNKCQTVGLAGMVAPQNLHFTGSLFWSEETVWPLPHKGHMRLRLKIRRSADIKNGFKVLPPIQGFVLRTRNVQHTQYFSHSRLSDRKRHTEQLWYTQDSRLVGDDGLTLLCSNIMILL